MVITESTRHYVLLLADSHDCGFPGMLRRRLNNAITVLEMVKPDAEIDTVLGVRRKK